MKETNPAVTHITQPESDLCWATCILMMRNVLKEVNPDHTPQTISARSFYRDRSDANIGGADIVIKAAIEDWVSGVGKCGYHARSFTWDEVKQAIDSNKPILVGYGWSKGGGHAMVIGGYEAKGGGDWGFVRLFDPLRKEYKDISYDRLVKGDYDLENWPGAGKGHAWDATWYLL